MFRKCYTIGMKALILPAHTDPPSLTAWMIARDLEEILSSGGFETAVGTKLGGFRHSERFDAPVPAAKGRLFTSGMRPPQTPEEAMYLNGSLSRTFLEKDIRAIRSAVDAFKPDLIFDICRPAAPVAARLEGIPYISYVPWQRKSTRPFPAKCLEDLNRVLSANHLEQVLHLHDLLKDARLKYSFGTDFLFPRENGIVLLGALCAHNRRREPDRHLSVFLGAMGQKDGGKLVEDCFLGAPYPVYAWYGSPSPLIREQLKVNVIPRGEMIAGSSVCIHDGSDAVFTRCLYLGVPQIIITDGSFERSRTASALMRCGTGVSLNQDTLDMARLYETYRKLVNEPAYQKKADRVADVLQKDPVFASLLSYL